MYNRISISFIIVHVNIEVKEVDTCMEERYLNCSQVGWIIRNKLEITLYKFGDMCYNYSINSEYFI